MNANGNTIKGLTLNYLLASYMCVCVRSVVCVCVVLLALVSLVQRELASALCIGLTVCASANASLFVCVQRAQLSVRSFARTFVRSMVRSFVRSFVRLLSHSLIRCDVCSRLRLLVDVV